MDAFYSHEFQTVATFHFRLKKHSLMATIPCLWGDGSACQKYKTTCRRYEDAVCAANGKCPEGPRGDYCFLSSYASMRLFSYAVRA